MTMAGQGPPCTQACLAANVPHSRAEMKGETRAMPAATMLQNEVTREDAIAHDQTTWEPRPAGTGLDPVTVVQFPPIWGRNVSPFALKLETWLRLAGIPFVVETTTRLDKAPKGKLPYIIDGQRRIGDSSLAIAYLKDRRGIDPDSTLNEAERAEAIALQRVIEDHLYFVIAYSRFLDPEGFATVGDAFFATVPALFRPLARAYFRDRVRRLLLCQGLGRHEQSEIYAFGREDLMAISSRLGDRPFLLGERLTTIDAVAFGFLANILLVPVETELKRMAQDLPNLVAWCDAMEAGIYGEAAPGL